MITRDQPYKASKVPPVTLEPSKGPQLSLHPGGEPRGLSPGLRGTCPLRAALLSPVREAQGRVAHHPPNSGGTEPPGGR